MARKHSGSKSDGSSSQPPPLPPTANSNGAQRAADQIDYRRVRQLVGNIMSSRVEALQRALGGDNRRSVEDECGFPQHLTITEYQYLYDREPIAKRTVQVLPRECWQVQPEVYEVEDSHRTTAFERAFVEVGQRLRGEQSWYETKDNKSHPLWDVLKRADELCGVGSFGVVLLGIDDKLPLNEPAEGVVEQGSQPNEDLTASAVKQPYRLTTNASDRVQRKLLYANPMSEYVVGVTQWETNQASFRYGQPVKYQVRFGNVEYAVGSSVGAPTGTHEVHWSRVVHIADNLENSGVFGVSRMHTPYNRLYNIHKIASADGETYYRNCVLKLFFETHPELGGDVDIDDEELRDMMESMMNGLQQWGRLTGMSAKPIVPAVVDPTAHILQNIDAICIMIGVPKRVFMGSERGELASSQDDSAWNDRLRERQNGFISQRVIIPTVDRLIQLGVLPEPKSYGVRWPDLESMGEGEAATVANQWCDALNKYLAGQLENMIDPLDFLTHLCRMGEEEARAILERSLRWLEFQQWSRTNAVDLEPDTTWADDVPVGADEDTGVSVGHAQPDAAPEQGATPFDQSGSADQLDQSPYHNPNTGAADEEQQGTTVA